MPVDAMPFPEATDSEIHRIARGLRQKDAAVISEVVDRYQYRLARYLLYLSGSREQVEDLVQETWVRVLARAGQYKADPGLRRGCSRSPAISRSTACDRGRS
jgi:RNA polymerase sigma-70 factor (ECF subfamily)